MSDLPEEFKCTVTNWEYIYDLCREVADEVRREEYNPEIIVALARGGWFAGRCLCDFLGLEDLVSLKIEHYVGTAERSDEPVIRYPMPEGSAAGKDVLIVDDIADTGGSIRRAHDHVVDRNPNDVRTATLQLMQECDFEPDYVGQRLEEWAWIVYPWNFIEDLVDLIAGVMEKSDRTVHDRDDLRRLLRRYHQIDPVQLEIAQPDRLDEVLEEMTRRGVIEPAGDGTWRLAEDAAG